MSFSARGMQQIAPRLCDLNVVTDHPPDLTAAIRRLDEIVAEPRRDDHGTVLMLGDRDNLVSAT